MSYCFWRRRRGGGVQVPYPVSEEVVKASKIVLMESHCSPSDSHPIFFTALVLSPSSVSVSHTLSAGLRFTVQMYLCLPSTVACVFSWGQGLSRLSARRSHLEIVPQGWQMLCSLAPTHPHPPTTTTNKTILRELVLDCVTSAACVACCSQQRAADSLRFTGHALCS